MNLRLITVNDNSYISIDLISNKEKRFFSLSEFQNIILNEKYCFLCGIILDEENTNKEHVFPNWIIKKYLNQKSTIKLPNNANINYTSDGYKIPCCLDCNSLYGDKLEKIMSSVLVDYNSIYNFCFNDIEKGNILFVWLVFIFFKNCYKDLSYKYSLKDNTNEKIGELYYWNNFHHLHNIILTLKNETAFNHIELGSIFLFKHDASTSNIYYHYFDNIYNFQSFFIFNDCCVISVIDDAGYSNIMFRELIENIEHYKQKILNQPNRTFNIIQLLEIYSLILYMNKSNSKKSFYTEIDCLTNEFRIKSEKNNTDKFYFNSEEFGEIFYQYLYKFVENNKNSEYYKCIETNKSNIKKGIFSFL